MDHKITDLEWQHKIAQVTVDEPLDCVSWQLIMPTRWPCGPTDKAPDYESGDSRFKSWLGQSIFFLFLFGYIFTLFTFPFYIDKQKYTGDKWRPNFVHIPVAPKSGLNPYFICSSCCSTCTCKQIIINWYLFRSHGFYWTNKRHAWCKRTML